MKNENMIKRDIFDNILDALKRQETIIKVLKNDVEELQKKIEYNRPYDPMRDDYVWHPSPLTTQPPQ